jgi:site-specific DNA-adenine methylase
MRLKQFFPFFGSKLRTIYAYPAPKFETIIEPFAGSASYSCTYSDKNVILSDIDPNIYQTWHYLINSSENDISDLPLISVGQSVDSLNICQEAKLLIGWWLNRGSSVPKKTMTRFANQWGDKFAQTWGNKVKERIISQKKYIKHWKAFNLSFESLEITNESTWFIDPPYQQAGKSYRFNKVNYEGLAEFIGGICSGQVIVCENEGADWLDFEPLLSARSNRSKGFEAVKKEVIFTVGCEDANDHANLDLFK